MQRSNVYTVSSKTIFSFADQKVIKQLYQPIIGVNAAALYELLWSEFDFNKVINVTQVYLDRLCKILNVGIDEIDRNSKILNSLGLINLYKKESDKQTNYHFVLKAPLKAEAFFRTAPLRSKLYKALGKDNFIRTSLLFSTNKIKLDDYEKVVTKFSDVFNHEPHLKVHYEDRNYQIEDRAKIAGDLDLSLVELALEQYHLENILKDNMIKEHIQMVNLAYKVSIDQLVAALVDSVKNETFDYDRFEENVKARSSENNSGSNLNLVYMNPQSSQDQYGANSVANFLKKYYPHMNITMEKLNELEKIMYSTKIKPSFMNILIQHTLTEQSYLNTGWMKPIAQTLVNKFTNDYDVLEYLNNISKTNQSRRQANKKAKSPVYQKESIGQVDKLYVDKVEKTPEDLRKRLEKEIAEREKSYGKQ